MKTFCSGLTISALLALPLAPTYADAPQRPQTETIEPTTPASDTFTPAPEEPSTPTDAPNTTAEEATTPTAVPDTAPEEATAVGPAKPSSSKKKTWQNIGLAVAAVAIAVTALILVSNNSGHHKNN